MVYYIVFGLFLLIALGIELNERKYWHVESFMIILATILLIIIAGFRYDTGYDYYSYEQIYKDIIGMNNNMGKIINNGQVEPAYALVNWLFSYGFKLCIFVIALLGVIPKMIYYYKLEHHRFFCVWLYFATIFIFYDMGVIRQGISIGILYYSIRYIEERKKWKFFFLVVLAAMFHLSAVFFLPMYWIKNRRCSRKIYYGGAAIALFFSTGIIRDLLFKLVMYIPSAFVSYKLGYYLSLTQANMMTSLIKRIFILVIFVEFFCRSQDENSKARLYINGYALSVVLTGIFSSMETIGGRGVASLYYLQIFIFAEMLKGTKSRIVKAGIWAMVILLFLSSMRGVINSASITPYIPYRNWIFE